MARLAAAIAATTPSRWFGRMPAVQAAVGALLLPAALVFAPAKFPVPHVGWMWVVAAAIAAGWWVAARVVSRHTEAAAALGATMTAATLVVALAVLVPPVANVTTARDLADTINRSGRFPPELWMVEQRSGSLVFYLDPALRRGLTRQRVLQLSSPQVPEHEPVPGTRVASRSATRPGSRGTCSSKGSRTCRPGTTACTMGSGCCTATRR